VEVTVSAVKTLAKPAADVEKVAIYVNLKAVLLAINILTLALNVEVPQSLIPGLVFVERVFITTKL
jgi:hypothetical protein